MERKMDGAAFVPAFDRPQSDVHGVRKAEDSYPRAAEVFGEMGVTLAAFLAIALAVNALLNALGL